MIRVAVAGAAGRMGETVCAAVDSIASTTRPFRFSRERMSSSSSAGSATQRSSSSASTDSASGRFSGRVPTYRPTSPVRV